MISHGVWRRVNVFFWFVAFLHGLRCGPAVAEPLRLVTFTLLVCSTHVSGSACRLAGLGKTLAARHNGRLLVPMGDLNSTNAPGQGGDGRPLWPSDHYGVFAEGDLVAD